MMLQPIGIRILKKSAHMTEKGEKSQSASRRKRKLPVFGVLMTNGEWQPILQSQGKLEKGAWYEIPVSDVEKKNPSLIMKTMTNLWKSCGFANLATNNGTKN